jgi:ATP-dependent Clp protease protease subunit
MTDLIAANPIPELIRSIEGKYVTVYVNHFDEASAKAFYDDFRLAQAQNQEIVPVVIDSYGGHVDALMSMVDVMLNYPGKVATIVQGKAMSCGSMLLACGSAGMRYASPNSRVMVHHVSSFSWAKVPDMIVEVEETKRLQDQLFSVMAQRCGQPDNYFLDLLEKHHNVDLYMTPKTALKHKIVDYVKAPKLKVAVDIKLSLE